MTGRPPFRPTTAQRQHVQELASAGLSHSGIASAIGISRNTLEDRFAAELQRGVQMRQEAREAAEVEGARRRAEVIRLLFEAAQRGNTAALIRLERLTRRGVRA